VRANFRFLFTQPHKFFLKKEFFWIWFVYIATYTMANLTDSACTYYSVSPTLPKFFTTTATNMPACIMKDRAFVRMFGLSTPGKLPMVSFGLFAMRDCITLGASFSLPKVISDNLNSSYQLPKSITLNAAQLLCPVLIQFCSTPLHLLALDFYNF